MASTWKPKDRNVYKMEFKDQHGITRKASSGMTDGRAAQALADKIEQDADRVRAGLQPLNPEQTASFLGGVSLTGLTWAEFRQRFETEHVSSLRDRSGEKYQTVFTVFEEECSPKALREINEELLSRFAANLRKRQVTRSGTTTGQIGLAPWTIKNYLAAIRAALEWAAGQKLIVTVPTIPSVKVPKKKPHPIEQLDFDKLLAAAPNAEWQAYLLCGWFGGLRLSEALYLRRSRSNESPWLDLAADRITFPAEFVKAGEDQWVPLHPTLRAALVALPDTGDAVFNFRSKTTGQPLSRTSTTHQVLRFAQRAGVKLSMHSLRKGFGCRVAQQLGKGNAPILHQLMRHSSMQITMDFYANVDSAMHDAIKQLDAKAPAVIPDNMVAAPG